MLDLNTINRYLNPPIKLIQVFPLEGNSPTECRKYLREQLHTCLQDSHRFTCSDEELKKVLDLRVSPPYFKNFTVSISHCKNTGGFVIADKDVLAGFDIELKDRIHQELIQRVSSEQEMKLFKGHYHNLWTLKEAGFKALSLRFGLSVVSELQFSSFQSQQDELSTSKSVTIKDEQFQEVAGVCIEHERFTIGILTKKDLTLV